MAKKKAKHKFVRELDVRFRKRRVRADAPIDQPLTEPEKVVAIFRDLEDSSKEKLLVISLDSQLKISGFEIVAVGSILAVSAKLSEVLYPPIIFKASSMILLHNHPSGDPSPSREDKALTKKVARISGELGITLADHIIVSPDDFFSFAREGLLRPKSR